MKRTTLVIDDEIFRKIKQEAARSGESLKDYVNNLLKRSLVRKEKKTFKLEWKTVKGKRPPSVPVDDRDRLYDFFDEAGH